MNLCLGEWLRGENALGDEAKLVDLFCFEPFPQNISQFVGTWLLYQRERKSLENAAGLADDFVCPRDADRDNGFVNLGTEKESETNFKFNQFIKGYSTSSYVS